MKMNRLVAMYVAVFTCAAAFGQNISTGDIKPLSAVRFSQDDDVKCLLSAIEAGDPKAGRSTLILKATPGCVVPWHYHTEKSSSS
jgi:hypothetical protein